MCVCVCIYIYIYIYYTHTHTHTRSKQMTRFHFSIFRWYCIQHNKKEYICSVEQVRHVEYSITWGSKSWKVISIISNRNQDKTVILLCLFVYWTLTRFYWVKMGLALNLNPDYFPWEWIFFFFFSRHVSLRYFFSVPVLQEVCHRLLFYPINTASPRELSINARPLAW